MSRHVRLRHFGERPFPCPICPLKCAAKADLQRHVLIHTGEKPFQCSRCLKRFRRNWSLKKHYKSSLPCRKS
ncbi:UNVERIFIED_CONTAM: hypothetical protein GTU68_060724 [Idotea baltica]|nr:hypothetical protein [Idotea baltica]